MAPKEAGEDTAMRRRRLRWRAWHRGMRELDLILGPFADARVEALGPADLGRLEALLGVEDIDLLKWATGQAEPPSGVDLAMLDDIRTFARRS